eukprot:g1197.t1
MQLGDNQLTGTISSSLFKYDELVHLDLSGNLLNGKLDFLDTFQGGTFPTLATLEILDIGLNQLSGTIDFVMAFSKAKQIYLQDNRFTGTIPTHALQWTDPPPVVELDLSNNALNGTVPPVLTTISSLASLKLQNNRLTGDIPSGWCRTEGNPSRFCSLQVEDAATRTNTLGCELCNGSVETPTECPGTCSCICGGTSSGGGTDSDDDEPTESVFFSKYSNGERSNGMPIDYVTLFNPTANVIDLSSYRYGVTQDGADIDGDPDDIFAFSSDAFLAPKGERVMCSLDTKTQHAREGIELHCDGTFINSYTFNGNDAICVMKLEGTSSTTLTKIDCIGMFSDDPGLGWDACGIPKATKNHILVRKCNTTKGNFGNWTTSAGTDFENCDFVVHQEGSITDTRGYVEGCEESIVSTETVATTEMSDDDEEEEEEDHDDSSGGETDSGCAPNCLREFTVPLKLVSRPGLSGESILNIGVTKNVLNITIARYANVSRESVECISISDNIEDPNERHNRRLVAEWYDLKFVVNFESEDLADTGAKSIEQSCEESHSQEGTREEISIPFVATMLETFSSQSGSQDNTAMEWEILLLVQREYDRSNIFTEQSAHITNEQNAHALNRGAVNIAINEAGDVTRNGVVRYVARSYGVWGVNMYRQGNQSLSSNVTDMSQYSEYIRGITFVEDTGEVDSVPFVPESDNGNEEAYQISTITVVVLLVSVLVAFTIISVAIWRKFVQARKAQDMMTRSLLTKNNLIRLQEKQIQDMKGAWLLDPSEIETFGGPCAEGAQGKVYRGSLHGKYEVAIKIMSHSFVGTADYSKSGTISSSSESAGSSIVSNSLEGSRTTDSLGQQRKRAIRELFSEKEVKFMVNTRSERLVLFLGVGMLADGRIFVVSEFMGGGSLDRMLWTHSKSPVRKEGEIPSWSRRLRYLRDVALGLKFIHSTHRVHRDLKSPNVLLDDHMRRCKIADFGLAAIVPRGKRRVKMSRETQSDTSTKSSGYTWIKHLDSYVGTPAWMAPELMCDSATYGPMVDIYSFGCVMYEHLTLQKPWRGKSSQSIMSAVKRGNRPFVTSDVADDAPLGFCDLMRRCWNRDITGRPQSDEIIDVLQSMLGAFDGNQGSDESLEPAPPSSKGTARTLKELKERLKRELDASEAWSDRASLTRDEIKRWEMSDESALKRRFGVATKRVGARRESISSDDDGVAIPVVESCEL